MTWIRPDGRTYREADHPSTGIERVLVGVAPAAPETPVGPTEPIEAPIDSADTARERLSAVLDRIKSGELAALGELPSALALARKEHRNG